MSEGWMEAFRGVVYPWHCDHLGHLTVQHYVGMFDQASWHLLSAVGFTWEATKQSRRSFVDARHTVEYKAEQPVGSLIAIESAVTRIGGKSITLLHRMKNVETGVLAATSEIVCIHFDLEKRASVTIPEAARERIARHLVPAE